MKCEKIPKMDWDIFNERFEVYFFLYFIGYVLVWRLNYEYISAKYIHSLNVNGELQQDFNTSDSSGLVVPITATDLGSVYCNGSETTALALDTTKITMKGIERETLKVYAALLIPSITVTFIYGIISDFTGKRKFMMSLSSFSNAIYALIIVLDFYIGEEIGQKNLIIGAFIAGCFGNWAATTVALTTYVADVTKPEERFLRMGIVILIMKLVYAACEGPLVYWIKTTGFQQPIWFTFAATGLACSIQIQIMDESQPMNRDYKDFNLGNFYYWLFTTKFKAVFDKYFFFLVISYSFLVFITEGYYMRLSYATYSLIVCGNYNLPFGYMHYIAWNLIGSIGMILVLIPVFRKIPETLLAIIGMASIAAGLIFLPFCKEEWMYYTGNINYLNLVLQYKATDLAKTWRFSRKVGGHSF